MKKVIASLCIVTLFIACKRTTERQTAIEELTTAQKIANAHGYKHWNKVHNFEFRFGGKMEDSNSGRHWKWNPKNNYVRLIRNNDTTYYNRNNMDSIAIKADRAFINDKFWALIPFQLVWDEGTIISEPVRATSPVNQKDVFKITITYSDEGGYTPGDAYDIFYADDYIIREWVYRSGNQEAPSLTNTFENYQNFNGLKIALEHKRTKDDWNLLIRNVKVDLED